MCDFTLHSMDWNSVAPLLCEFRMTARTMGLSNNSEPIADENDLLSLHALALMDSRVIGAARLTRQGRIERMIVLPHSCRNQIEAALVDALKNHAATHLHPSFGLT